jgi:5-methylthioadenosine/S-adenosylhomocysteine deaminase
MAQYMSDDTPRTLLIQGALVLSMDPALGDLESGDVLVEGRRISQVGTALEAPAGAQRIDGRGMILIPA